MDCERPEMRGCPDEDDEEQQQRVRFDGVGDRRPAEHRGCSARRAADLYTLIETAKLNGVDPEAWLRDTINRIAG